MGAVGTVARSMMETLQLEALLVTRSEKGMLLVESGPAALLKAIRACCSPEDGQLLQVAFLTPDR